jgi:arylformamidase
VHVVDLTLSLRPDTLVAPGDPPISLRVATDFATHGYQVTDIRLGSHSGTHLDAPRHIFPEGKTIDQYPVERFISEGVVLDLRGAPSDIVEPDMLAASLRKTPLKLGDFILLWTHEERSLPKTLSPESARLLVNSQASLVGVDGPSVDAEVTYLEHEGAYPVHRILLASDILIVENLTGLDRLGSGRVKCIFLPLAVEGTDGAPIRAVAWKLDVSR